MQEKVEILIEGKDPINVELLSEFEVNNGGNVKRFILLTNNDIDQNGLIKLLASEIDGGQIKKIESDDDWTKVKNIMRSIIAASPEPITYINTSEHKSFNASENYARVIAVQDSAKQAIAKDYFEKRPDVEKQEIMEPTEVEDPNASIYPTENEIAPIGSEIANGISETPEITPMPEVSDTVEDEDAPIENYDNYPEDIPTTSVNNIVNTNISYSTNDISFESLKAELIEEISAAVDKYIENIKLNIENRELKSIIDKLTNEKNS